MKINNENMPRTDIDSTVPHKKIEYSSPVFRVFGSVSKLTQNGGGTLADAMNTLSSERRVKENIFQIGVHPTLGIGLYLFDYKSEYREKFGYGRQFGVMADEVETIMPTAVSRYSDGFKRVNYDMLGISQALH